MALFYIGTQHTELVSFSEKVHYAVGARQSIHIGQDELLFFTANPIVKQGNGYVDYAISPKNDLKEILTNAQNNFCAFQVTREENGLRICASSSRFARARMYFLQANGGYYFSEELRNLLPFSNKRLNHAGIYSTIKFGNVPEYITCVQGIFSVPVSSFLSITVDELITSSSIEMAQFKTYFQLPYSFAGADLQNTEHTLSQILSHTVQHDFAVPISGGIDSSLMNYMVNDLVDHAYPAYYLAFEDNDPEIPFAKEAAKNTKAELEIFTMRREDFVDAFHYQAAHISQPIGETSAISMAYLFSRFAYSNHKIVDGTLADGCYGSKNYNKPVFQHIKSKSKAELVLNEKISAFLQLYDLPYKNRFFPRDSQIQDPYLQQMNVYTGALSNVLFQQASCLNAEILPYWAHYYELIQSEKGLDDWMKYSIFKMVNYAANTTIAKTYDLCGHPENMVYPFMWQDILIDQGKYTWQQKTQDNIIKYPLKKLIEKYASKEFIYRKKVGLNSSTSVWMSLAQNKAFLIDQLSTKDSLAEAMIGKANLNRLLKTFATADHHPYISALVISFASIERWKQVNGLTNG